MLRDKFEEIENLDSRKKTGIYIAIPLILFALFYFLFLSSALDEFDANQKKTEALQEELNKPTLRLLLAKTVRLKKEIVKNKTAIEQDREQLNYFQHKLDSKSFLFISKKSISLFLDKLLDNSLHKGVLIQAITLHNENKPYIGNLKLKKVIDVNASGRFLNELSFLRSVEKSTMLIKVENLHIFLQETNQPLFSFEVKFYGVEK
ncbi:hypothetical protein LCX93_02415 [Sulfurimonas sp. SWIR-19]|uniref:hypothetical protein n=1 Tax=Sulfurimonas sp. SWIR-19 TaxID=2878390 RepID=UPI001CF56541|nr:hypothetical protein [Sulfurimonas sp. SWIR-19]UCN00787.1 hypothetical protein LCX93_02415 [Sulfurimonas sp. SWIR-19]